MGIGEIKESAVAETPARGNPLGRIWAAIQI
jgi:hypothetical protein